MKVVVLGSGVIGVSSAYYLAKAGHEVVVLDRQPGPALETSFGNAGEISPGYSSPWAGPGVPVKAIKWLLMKHGPLVLRPKFSWMQWRWMASMLANCTHKAYAINKGRMVRVAEYSRDCLVELRRDTNITYDNRALGTLQVFRTQKQLDAIGEDIEVLKQYGVPYEVLDPAGCVGYEPALGKVSSKFVGGMRLPHDETGDCQMFTTRLAEMAAALGVSFRYGTDIQGIQTEAGKVSGIVTSAGLVTGDRYIVALGSYSPFLVKPLGISLPVYPVKGYSITVPITNPDMAPVSTVMDETYKVAITRLGDRIRVGGTAEVCGWDLTLRDGPRGTLEFSVGDLFPDGGDIPAASFWTGLRPMTPDGTPIIGPTRYPNLYLNTGHGTLGWTMGAGSGRVIADIISGKTPDIDVSDLPIARYAA